MLVRSVFVRCSSVGSFNNKTLFHVTATGPNFLYIEGSPYLVNRSLHTKLHGLNKVLLSENKVTCTIIRRRSYMLEECGHVPEEHGCMPEELSYIPE